MVEVGRAEDLYARPRTLFAATFLGSGTVLMGRMRGGEARFDGLDVGIAPQVAYEEGASAYLLLRPEDLAGSQGGYQLRTEILRRVNLVISPSKANAVLIEEMLVN